MSFFSYSTGRFVNEGRSFLIFDNWSLTVVNKDPGYVNEHFETKNIISLGNKKHLRQHS